MHVAIAAALLALGQPSIEEGEVTCILQALPAADRPQLARDTLSGAESDLVAKMDQAVEACVGRLGWDPAEAGTMAGLTAAIIMRDDAALQLDRAGIAPAHIERWFSDQSADVRTNPEIGTAVLEALILELQQTGIKDQALEAEGETIGVYVGARIMIERAERGLPLG